MKSDLDFSHLIITRKGGALLVLSRIIISKALNDDKNASKT